MDDQELNPYAPPATAIESTMVSSVYDYPEASKGKRFLNFFIDRLAVYGLAVVTGVALAFVEGLGWVEGWLEAMGEMSTLADMVFTGILSAFYYVACEASFGRTLGKLITGTKVLDDHGEQPSFGAILGRTLARLVPFEPLSFLGNTGGWHDRWSGTQVIDLRKKAALATPPPL